jgi:hypothetical protein
MVWYIVLLGKPRFGFRGLWETLGCRRAVFAHTRKTTALCVIVFFCMRLG